MEEELFEISADSVVVEVVDKHSGRCFRRELPIDFLETANLLRLRGESLDGSMSELVFYTARGVERVRDLTGRGAEHDGCGEHN